MHVSCFLRAQGFRKVRNTCWTFANAYFQKDHEADLVNIKRRKGAKDKATPDPSAGVRLELTRPASNLFFRESF